MILQFFSKVKYSSYAHMGVCVFCKNGEPLHNDEYNKTFFKLWNEWNDVKNKFNFYMIWKNIK